MIKYLFLICLLTAFCITNAQNVGIGTSNPTEKLHVVGNVKADTLKPSAFKLTSGAGEGKVLTSDAAGNASWALNNSSSGSNIGYGVWGDCATNGNISEYQPVVDNSGSTNDYAGYSVSISGNYAIVGAANDDVGTNPNQGSASIYRYNGSSWVLMKKITDATGAANDNFGISVSISDNYAIVGAANDDVGVNTNQGSASFYHYTGSSWELMQKITDAGGAANDNFGTSVSISGNYAIVGISNDDVGVNSNQGSASIYLRNGPLWRKLQNVVDPAGSGGDDFGCSVSLDATTKRFLVGAFEVNNGMGIAVFGKIN
ncbi:MAG: FG-GAP repeat protein [Ferruginibacter sp.]|nr:FG-GAP repeat protein [Ferruginibacter sp.]